MLSTEALKQALIADIGRTKKPSDSSSTAHWAAYALQQGLLKKYSDLTTSRDAEEAALRKFMKVNDMNEKWLEPDNGPAPDQATRILMRAKDLCASQYRKAAGLDDGINQMSLAHAFNIGMTGPGAAVNATSDYIVDKLFNSKLTCTNPILFKYYRQAIAHMKPWFKAERLRERLYGDYEIYKGNKLFYVPKEAIIARTAATEPTLNMFGQLGYGELICQRLLAGNHNIDLSTQPLLNRWFALSGSLSGEYATIDLSSASDTIGMRFSKWFLPKDMMRDLSLLRSPITYAQGRGYELKMISTMGNGFTFPLQTWIFANLVLATMIETGEPVFDIYGKRRYSVFGDDIICPTRVYDAVAATLQRAGFTVNATKSFATGGFRESCGGDFFKGVNVRSVYLKEYTGPADVYSLINRLMDWQILHGIYLPKVMSYLRTLVAFRPIPQYEDERAGIRVPLSRLTSRKIGKSGHLLYRPLRQKVVKVKPCDATVEKFYHGFHVAFLHGSFSWGRATPRVRPGEAVYKVAKCESPIHWDFVLDARFTIEERTHAFELCFPKRAA